MTDTHTPRDEREEIEMMLPWYVAGTLDRTETRRVEAYLRDHPDLQDHIDLVREEMEETVGVNESLGTPSPGALDRLMERVEGDAGPAVRTAGARPGPWQRLAAAWAELSPRATAIAAACAVVLICFQAAVIFTGPEPFQTASGEGEQVVHTGTFAQVMFESGATIDEINTLMATLGTKIVDGPKANGIYRVRLSEKVLPEPERDAVIGRLQSSDLVRAVLPMQ
ncbi:MAG: hypothetical protein ACR2PM_01575 [Hyphomicrobiales bacterium]